jgi:hypothetical protein
MLRPICSSIRSGKSANSCLLFLKTKLRNSFLYFYSFLPYRLAPSSILLRRNASSISVELGDVFKTHCKWIYFFWLFYFFHCYLLCIPNTLQPSIHSLRPTVCTAPSTTVTATKEELVGYLKMMYTMRRMEITCDTEYKVRNKEAQPSSCPVRQSPMQKISHHSHPLPLIHLPSFLPSLGAHTGRRVTFVGSATCTMVRRR